MEFINLFMHLAYDSAKVCSDFAAVFGILGWVYNIIRIAVPIILIIMGMIDLIKPITGNKDTDLSDAFGNFLKKFVAAVAVFLVLYIVKFVFVNVVGNTTWAKGNCWSCVVDPQQSVCKMKK